MRTHRLVTPQGNVVERPCSAWCRDGRHATVAYHIVDVGPAEAGRTVVRHNPAVRIVAVERAGELAPPPDVLAHFAGWGREDLIGYLVIYESAAGARAPPAGRGRATHKDASVNEDNEGAATWRQRWARRARPISP